MKMETKKAYKWQLRKSSKKEICPNCGQKRFVPFVLTEDNTTLAGSEYGRCDRINSCGYFRYPGGDVIGGNTLPKEDLQPLRWRPSAIGCIGETFMRNALTGWLFEQIAPMTSRGVTAVIDTLMMYKVRSLDGQPIFWQVHPDGSIRAAKTIPYKSDGHRNHDAKYPAYYLHRLPKFRDFYEGKDLEQIFFGANLLTRDVEKIIIVESEKTALALDVLTKHKHIILATGGAEMIKSVTRCDLVERYIHDRPVIVYPDQGQYYSWRAVCNRYGWRCSDVMETMAAKDGDDVLDLILQNSETLKNI